MRRAEDAAAAKQPTTEPINRNGKENQKEKQRVETDYRDDSSRHHRGVEFQLPTADQSPQHFEEIDLEEDDVCKKLPNDNDVKKILKD